MNEWMNADLSSLKKEDETNKIREKKKNVLRDSNEI